MNEPGCDAANMLDAYVTDGIDGCAGEGLRLYAFAYGVNYAEGWEKPDAGSLIKKAWEDIRRAWPEGTFLVWRKRPEITDELMKDGTRRLALRMRIGSYLEPIMEEVK